MTIATLIEKFQEDISWLGYNPTEREIIKHIEYAITLLEEQQPKAIVNKWHKNPLGDYSRLHCPWCDRELDTQSAKEYVACPYCGKAMKWK